ncbi:MAG: ABC transporter substrate-binding protein [Acidipila sp.]|nr:ABC transporter substrate-binding protein [Acidipila sp.]
MVTASAPGRTGGKLVIALRSEPKTLNPILAVDASSRDVIRCLTADLIHINRASQKTEPALAKSWNVSADGRSYTLHLRKGLQFSDGRPVDADDVVFSFALYVDEKVHSPQRDLLVIGGKPITARKLDAYTVLFELAKPYAAAERLFDSLAIVPRHLLETAYQLGKLSESWTLSAPASQFAGLGPFRLKEYVPGTRIVLERNPYYWKEDSKGKRLPYLDEVVFLFVATEDAQVIRFQAGETDILSRFSAENFDVLEKQRAAKKYTLYDLGPGLEYNFIFFNLNDLPAKQPPDSLKQKQAWFEDIRFRQAVSAAIDRDSIVRLAYNGRATPLWGHVTPGNKLWLDANLPHPERSIPRARQLLQSAGFKWNSDGALLDAHGSSVEFSVLTSSSNAQRTKIATLLQDDLRELGMNVHVVPLEFRAMVDRLLNTHDYEAAIMGLASGDADPNPEMNVWLSSGGTHLWHPNQTKPATTWEAEIDRLMEEQLTTLNYAKRKRMFDRVQEIVAENVPIICVVSPNILVGAGNRLGNVRPVIIDPYALWNIEELYIR